MYPDEVMEVSPRLNLTAVIGMVVAVLSVVVFMCALTCGLLTGLLVRTQRGASGGKCPPTSAPASPPKDPDTATVIPLYEEVSKLPEANIPLQQNASYAYFAKF